MSIVSKIDEIFYSLNSQNIDIALFTETWLKNVRPRRLPRAFSSIIIGVVYIIYQADNESMRDYIRDCLTKIEVLHPHCGVIVAGDFNSLDTKSALRLFQPKHLINFPTRGSNTLDFYQLITILC